MLHYSPRQVRWSLLCFAINFLLGLFFCFIISPRLIGSGLTVLDPDGYGADGIRLYETGQITTIDKPPLYPAWVALVAWLSGGFQLNIVLISQCLLLASACVILYGIFRETIPVHAHWAALACSVYPMLLWYTSRLWTETFLTFLLALLVYLFIRLIRSPGLEIDFIVRQEKKMEVGFALLCGVVCGLVILTKGALLIFAGLLPMITWGKFRQQAWLKIIAFLTGLSVLVIPWIWRNYQLSGEILPIHTRGGYNFFIGNGFARHWLQAPFSYSTLKSLTQTDIDQVYREFGRIPQSPLEADHVLMQASLNELSARPWLFPWKIVVNSLTIWYLAADPAKSLFTGLMQLPVVFAALSGIYKAWKRRSKAINMLIPIVGILAGSLPILSFARLSSVIMPYLIGLSFENFARK